MTGQNHEIRVDGETWFESRVSVLRNYRHLLWAETRPEHAEQLRREIASTLAYFSPTERVMAERLVWECECRQVQRWYEALEQARAALAPVLALSARAPLELSVRRCEAHLDKAIERETKALECFTAAEKAVAEEERRLSAPETKQKAPTEFPRGRRLLAEMEAN